jgi:predicted transcriptional regulator
VDLTDDKKTLRESVTFRCPAVLKQALERIAANLDRSLSWVICSKLKESVTDEVKQEADEEIERNDSEERQ